MFPQIERFPALFRGPKGEVIIFVIAFPTVKDEVYYSRNGSDFVSLTIVEAVWLGSHYDRQRLALQESDVEPRIIVWRKLSDNFVTIDEKNYIYVPDADPAACRVPGVR